MSVIYPGLFLVIERFPDRKKVLSHLYACNAGFQTLCENYRQCTTAIRYWAQSEEEKAPERRREYGELLHELEMEILQYCSEELHANPD